MTTRTRRPAAESYHETSRMMMPTDANNLGHVFGGAILAMIDTTAAVSAIRHARATCVTASIDRVDFREPIYLGDLVIMQSAVNFAGRTSMEVGVRVVAEDLRSGKQRHTNSAYVTFVAVDVHGHPIEVPELLTESDEERARFAAGARRRERRVEDRAAEAKARAK